MLIFELLLKTFPTEIIFPPLMRSFDALDKTCPPKLSITAENLELRSGNKICLSNSFCKIISEAPIDFKSFSALACLVKAVTLKPILDRIKIENKPTLRRPGDQN